MKKMTSKEKMDYIINIWEKNPNFVFSTSTKTFPDQSSIKNFWLYSKTIVSDCKEKRKLTDNQLYIIQSHAYLDNQKGIHASMTPKEKMDYIYALVQKDPSIPLYSTDLLFPDGTKINCFWALIESKIIHSKEKVLTPEETYMCHTSALIDEVRGRNVFQSPVEKLKELLEYVQIHPNVNLATVQKTFKDNTVYKFFWNWIQVYIKRCLKKVTLTEEETLVLYYAAKIEETQNKNKERNFETQLKKVKYLYTFLRNHPLETKFASNACFPDKISFQEFYQNLLQEYQKKDPKKLGYQEREMYTIFQHILNFEKRKHITLAIQKKPTF